MKTLQTCRALARYLIAAGAAGAVLVLTGCSLWDSTFSSPPAAPIASMPALPVPAPAPAPVAAGFYRANAGDTLASVAEAFGRDASQIANWNRLPAGFVIGAGQVLRVAPWPVEAAAASAPAPAAPAASRFAWPVSGPVTSPFVAGESKGILLVGAPNETVKAADAGRVIYAGTQLKAYGQIVIIKHSDGFVSAYGNNAKILVKEGDTVRQGQPIAQMGADSDASRTLIFELREGGKAVDPQRYLPKRAG
jgi:lipoprotein NlpD